MKMIAILIMTISTAAFADVRILIQGTFGPAEGCTPGLAVTGVVSGTQDPISLCTYNADQANFTNGASDAALTDGKTYYVEGVEQGEGEVLVINEISGL